MSQKNTIGFTLVEVIVGMTLMLIVFLGILAAFQLGTKVVDQSKNKITATAIANQHLEKIRNLPYPSVGTQGAILPYAEGVLEPDTVNEMNGVEYTVETKVKFISDEADGRGTEDPCDLDYKRVEVKVSWNSGWIGDVFLSTDIAPKDKVEEISACTAQPGGILSVRVFNAFGVMVDSPLIEIFDTESENLVDQATPFSGEYDFPLATSSYRVVVSKPGYSTDQSYGVNETYNGQTIITPEKSHPIVIEGRVTEISFSIDKTSSFSVNTLSPRGTSYFSDTFNNNDKIFQSFNVSVQGGEVRLATSTGGYLSQGFLTSIDISPLDITQWNNFSFTDLEPSGSDLKYQIYYASGTDWCLIPDTDLSENSIGFDASPIDLSGLDITEYSNLRLKVNFFSDSTNTTPILKNWEISWMNSAATPISSVVFKLEGEKLVGKNSTENPIYKYSVNHNSDAGGHINLSDMEWDKYTFSVDFETGLDLIDINPSSQPINLGPDITQEIDLYLDAENSLLITVQNFETLEPVFGATVRLHNVGLDYDVSQYTNTNGQTYFIPLEPTTYSLEISAPSYAGYTSQALISGDNIKTIKLEQIE